MLAGSHHAVAGAGRRLRDGERHHPRRTSLGAHSVFAVGSLGSTASAAFTVIDNTAPVVSAAVINKTVG